MSNRPTVIVDGRMMYQPQCYGIARVTVEMVKRFPARDDVDVVLIVPESRASDHFATRELADHAELVTCADRVTAVHRVGAVRSIVKSRPNPVFFAPYHPVLPLSVPGPVAIMVHDCILESDLRLVGGRARQLAYTAVTARALGRANAVLVNSADSEDALYAHYGKVPPVTVCRLGVETERYADSTGSALLEATSARHRRLEPGDGPGPESTAHRLGLPARYVLHVGARRPHKNQQVLVRALPDLPADVCLVLVGKPDPRTPDELPKLAAELGVADRVIFLESLADEDLAEVYRNAEVFAFPSLAEGFGLPPLEAMAAGVPVVASALPVIAEVGQDAPLLVSPFDPPGWRRALNRVLRDPAQAASMARRGREVAAASTWEPGARRLFEVLVGLTGR